MQWIDNVSPSDQIVRISFPSFSNPIINDSQVVGASVGSSYGFLHMPSVGDYAVCAFRDKVSPVIIGYLPQNYYKQTLLDSSASNPGSGYGQFRSIIPGEYSLKSLQQAEVYLDQAGSVQIQTMVQPTNATSQLNVPPIDTATVPTLPETKVTIGDVYTDPSFTVKSQSFNKQPVVCLLNKKI